jgi:O-succinylbenzoate synthase
VLADATVAESAKTRLAANRSASPDKAKIMVPATNPACVDRIRGAVVPKPVRSAKSSVACGANQTDVPKTWEATSNPRIRAEGVRATGGMNGNPAVADGAGKCDYIILAFRMVEK